MTDLTATITRLRMSQPILGNMRAVLEEDLTALLDALEGKTERTGDELLGCEFEGVWRQAILNHRGYSANGDDERDLQFLTLGLCGEAGELANFVKKRWRDGVGHDDDIRKEVADVCAYAFMLCHVIGQTPIGLVRTIAEKQAMFVEKMKRMGRERA